MANFCPECGKATIRVIMGGRERDACPDGHFVQYAKTKIGVGALVFRGERVLLVERGIPPVGMWALPSGYIEQDEPIDEAVIREVHEETGLDIEPQGVVFVRNMMQRGISDIYLVFLCNFDPNQKPVPDGYETTRVEFIAPSEFDAYNVPPYTRWFVENYLANRPDPWQWVATPHDKSTTRIFTAANANVRVAKEA